LAIEPTDEQIRRAAAACGNCSPRDVDAMIRRRVSSFGSDLAIRRTGRTLTTTA